MSITTWTGVPYRAHGLCAKTLDFSWSLQYQYFFSFEAQDFDFENKFGIWLDAPGREPSRSIGIVGRTMNLGTFSQTHVDHLYNRRKRSRINRHTHPC